MTKHSHRLIAIVTILTLFLFLLPLLPHSPFTPRTASAVDNWWDAGWGYRKSFSISSGTGGTLTNYQVNITVYRSSGTDGDWKVYVGTKCEADYDDIRFTTSGASPSLLDYWLEDGWSASEAVFWVELNSVSTGGTTFFMYYGNASASAYSNGDNTFIFFDDFNDGNGVNDFDTAKWTKGTGATWGGDIYEDAGYLWLNDTSPRSSIWSDTGTELDDHCAVNFRTYFRDVRIMGFAENASFGAPDGTADCAYWKTETSDALQVEDNGVGGGTAYALVEQSWQELEVQYDKGTHVRGVVDGTVGVTDVAGLPDGTPDMNVFFYIYNGDAVEYLQLTWCFVRQYQSGEIVFGSWGSEDTPNVVSTYGTSLVINADETDDLYARHRLYEFMVRIDDTDGYADIILTKMILIDSTGADLWAVQYNQTADSFSEIRAPTYIELDATSNASGSANALTVYFKLYIEWVHPDKSNCDLRFTATDSEPNTMANATIDYNLDVETRLELDIPVTVWDAYGTNTRGDINNYCYVYGTVEYYDTNTDVTDVVDAWVSAFGVPNSPFFLDSPSAYGAFNVTCNTDDSVGLDTYTLEIVAEDAGAEGDDLIVAGTQSVNYIADQLTITITSPTYTCLPLGTNMTGVFFTATHQYDSAVAAGVALNQSTWLYNSDFTTYVSATPSRDTTHGVSGTVTGEFTATWTDISFADGTFWTRQTETTVFAHITLSGLQFDAIDTNVPDGAYAGIYHNSTPSTLISNATVASNAVFKLQVYTGDWDSVTWTFTLTYINAPYRFLNYTYYVTTKDVPNINTLYIDVFSMEIDDYYINIYWESNWHNSTCFIFKNGVYQSNVSTEGFAQIGKPITAGSYTYHFVFNASASMDSADQNYSLADGNYWKTRTRNVDISVTAYIVLVDGYGQVIQQERFEIYVDNVLLNPYEPFYVCTSSTGNITIYDEYWDEVIFTNASHPMSARVKISISCHWMIIVNQQDEAVYVVVTHNSVSHTFHGIRDRLVLLIFDGDYTAACYRERDDHEVAYLLSTGDWGAGETTTVSDDYIILTRPTPDTPVNLPNMTPIVMLLSMIGVCVFFVVIIVMVMGFRGRSGQKRLEQGIFSPPEGVKARPLTARPSKTQRDTRGPEEREYDSHTEEWDRIKEEADRQ